MPMDRKYVFAAIALVAVIYYYRKRSKLEQQQKKQDSPASSQRDIIKTKHPLSPTVRTKYDTKIIPLKPPRNDSFSKASPLHYKFNYSDPQYDVNSNSEPFQFKVITFNVLASCYAFRSNSYSSHCSDEHLKGEYRFTEIGRILHECNGDIIALQEVDDPKQTLKWMQLDNHSKYRVMYQKRTNKKQDGLLLAYNVEKFQPYNDNPPHLIKLNDLTLGCASENSQQYFRKNQIALYMLLQPLQNPSHLLFVINTHLYWHPDADPVRLRQIAYLLNIIKDKCDRLKFYDSKIQRISLVFCGDFNMLPHTAPHQFMLNGRYVCKAKGNSPLKLMMDSALNQVARWCRSLGVDCAYSSTQKLDTQSANELFEVCRKQNRILITRSKRLVARRDCPSHLLLNNHVPRDNLKQIIKYFGIQYDDNAMYTRCTLCNGLFRILRDEQEIQQEDQIPVELRQRSEEMTFTKCLQCSQVYWVGEKTKSEIEKFKAVFVEASVELDKEINESKHKLKRRLIKKQRLKEKLKQKQMEKQKNYVIISEQNVDENDENKSEEPQAEEPEVYDSDIGDLDDKVRLLPNLQRYFWEDVRLEHPYGDRLACSYSSQHSGKPPKYTNKTSKFKGCLDYIFYADITRDALKEQKVDEDDNDDDDERKEESIRCIGSELVEGDSDIAYPNVSWPSDHILLMSTFEIK